MKTLELKHIAPYLPYGLNIWYNATKGVILDKMDTSNIRDVILYNKNYKPILRPLSDLTKEIDHKGERFSPVTTLGWNSYEHIIERGVCDNVSYQYMVSLFSWHFDVFGLIDKGLAIDINELNKIK